MKIERFKVYAVSVGMINESIFTHFRDLKKYKTIFVLYNTYYIRILYMLQSICYTLYVCYNPFIYILFFLYILYSILVHPTLCTLYSLVNVICIVYFISYMLLTVLYVI